VLGKRERKEEEEEEEVKKIGWKWRGKESQRVRSSLSTCCARLRVPFKTLQ
jgi:hypothetical protein